MTEWLDRFLHEPMAQNGWSLAFLVVLAMAAVGLLVVEQVRSRRMFRRRDREATVSETKEPSEQEIRSAREQGMAEDMAKAQPLEPSAEVRPGREIDAEQEARWAAEGIPDTATQLQVGDTAVREVAVARTPFRGQMAVAGKAPAPAPLVNPVRVECEHCGGVGFVPGINDYLKESAAMIGDGDAVVRQFYTTLLNDSPALAYLFPSDITEPVMATRDGKGLSQREKLLGALVALAENYDPGSPEKMGRLNAALERFGRTHASFVRQDGTGWGATLEEYKAVKDALFSTLVRTVGEKWKPEYASAWSQAYDYAAAVMLAEQFRSGFTAPRFPRR